MVRLSMFSNILEIFKFFLKRLIKYFNEKIMTEQCSAT